MDGLHDVGPRAPHGPKRKPLLPRCVAGNGVSDNVNAIASPSCIEDGGSYTTFCENPHDIEISDSLGLKIAAKFGIRERARACFGDYLGPTNIQNARVKVRAKCASDSSAVAEKV